MFRSIFPSVLVLVLYLTLLICCAEGRRRGVKKIDDAVMGYCATDPCFSPKVALQCNKKDCYFPTEEAYVKVNSQ
ncbi:hypothetical protein TSAR_005983 [Trichomalopsis sarcophagae]|uniref:Uncharacterized protein n=1 Tax=Trichomalopsis sarcophagae TaxID=543379 RepID=A0A232FDT3_9HYME|nr:hypothetical protein TSAR_005983 [Trichomalopsis sarcophagae]